ncbi:hypothetical protein ANN_18367 [Periplaneta americana]|uniref:Uncharacterized protein n=1 Tax=Periplaneta americana TaxID=6978 RepID=A0ABQ8SNJ8_PERAM|nr:hypothetical protein ANN_18367 [Periplaneta americana]
MEISVQKSKVMAFLGQDPIRNISRHTSYDIVLAIFHDRQAICPNPVPSTQYLKEVGADNDDDGDDEDDDDDDYDEKEEEEMNSYMKDEVECQKKT